MPCLHCHRFFSAEPTKPVLFSWPVLPPVGARGNASQTSNPFARPRLLCFGPFGWRLSLPPSLVLVPAFRVRLHLGPAAAIHYLPTLERFQMLSRSLHVLSRDCAGRQTLLGRIQMMTFNICIQVSSMHILDAYQMSKQDCHCSRYRAEACVRSMLASYLDIYTQRDTRVSRAEQLILACSARW